MKQALFFSLISICIIGCSPRETLFDISSSMDFRVDLGLSTLESHSFIKSQVPVPLEFALNNNGLTDADLDQVVAQRAFLRPKFGDEINLDFINSVKISIIDQATLRPREIFFMDFVNFGFKTEIELMPSLTDIKDIVINDNASIEAKLQFRQFPPQTFEMVLDMTFGAFAIE